jgi:polyhydroxybutyrate depolymerase
MWTRMVLRTLCLWALLLAACPPGPEEDETPEVLCDRAQRDGRSGEFDRGVTEAWVRFTVRTPGDYDEVDALWPLVVVHAPAGGDQEITEDFTGLTEPALEADFLIAYADHRSPTGADPIREVASVYLEVARRWCVDPQRIYFTGHSDGGTVSEWIVLLDEHDPMPAAIAPSAAGFGAAGLASIGCGPATPVLVLHSRNDGLFPGRGAEAADFFAGCNGCSNAEPEDRGDGCVAFRDCPTDGEVVYCEGSGSHGSWPNRNADILDFFDAH